MKQTYKNWECIIVNDGSTERAQGEYRQRPRVIYKIRKDYNDCSLQICHELELDIVCANYPELVFKGVNKFTLPRFLIRNWDGYVFEKK